MATYELMDSCSQTAAVIRVIGVGGGGSNAVDHMLASAIEGVEFISANTDAQALRHSSSSHTLRLGEELTKGLGAGADPDRGRKAALEARESIVQALQGADMVFVTAGMGGGTGTGASPVIAQLAKEMGILTVAVVTKPFPFELKRRINIAEEGIAELSEHVDSLITVPNEKLLSVLERGTTLREAFAAANEVLRGAVQGIAELITRPGMINVDFADVRTVMSEKGRAMMGSGHASGEDRAEQAAQHAINCPLLEDVNLSGAGGILVNVAAGPDLGMDEFAMVGDAIGRFAAPDALVVMGTALDEAIEDDVRVTVVATGLSEKQADPQVRLVTPLGPDEKEGANRERRAYDPSSGVRSPPQSKVRDASSATIEDDTDYLDIPAFLRRQAD